MRSPHLALLASLLLAAPLSASHPEPPNYDMRLLAELRTQFIESGMDFQGVLRIHRGGATQTESWSLPVGGACGFREVGLAEASTAAIRELELKLAALRVGEQRGDCGLSRNPRPVYSVTWGGRNGRRRNSFAVGVDYQLQCPAEVRAIIAELQYFDKVLFGPDHRQTFAGPTCPPPVD